MRRGLLVWFGGGLAAVRRTCRSSIPVPDLGIFAEVPTDLSSIRPGDYSSLEQLCGLMQRGLHLKRQRESERERENCPSRGDPPGSGDGLPRFSTSAVNAARSCRNI